MWVLVNKFTSSLKQPEDSEDSELLYLDVFPFSFFYPFLFTYLFYFRDDIISNNSVLPIVPYSHSSFISLFQFTLYNLYIRWFYLTIIPVCFLYVHQVRSIICLLICYVALLTIVCLLYFALFDLHLWLSRTPRKHPHAVSYQCITVNKTLPIILLLRTYVSIRHTFMNQSNPACYF